MTYTCNNSLGGRIALGSDFPVESHNPLHTFYAAVTRLSMEGASPSGPDGWLVTQAEIKCLMMDRRLVQVPRGET